MSIRREKREYLDKCLNNSLFFGDDGSFGYLKYKKVRDNYVVTGFIDSLLIDNIYIDGIFSAIAKDAFRGSRIKSVTCGYGVKTIEESAFEDCRELVTVKTTDTIRVIGKSAFRNCVSLKAFTCGSKIYMVDSKAFEGCVLLDNINFGRNLQYLGSAVFSGCAALQRVQLTYTSIHKLQDATFKDCVSLKKISVPDTVKKIGENCFSGCSSLNVFEFHSKVSEIGLGAFEGCTALEVVRLRDLDMKPSKWSVLISGLNQCLSNLAWVCITTDGVMWLMEKAET